MWRSTGWSSTLDIAIAVSLLLVTPPVAQAQREEAQGLFEEAREYFDQEEYVEAAELFGQAFELDPHPAILYNQARCFQELGDLTRALALFQQTLGLDPDEQVVAQVNSRIEQIRLQLEEGGFHVGELSLDELVELSKLSITSLPDHAEVFLREEFIGTTPIEDLYVPPGRYPLVIALAEYLPHRRTLEVESGQNLSIHAGLRRIEAVQDYQPPEPGMIEVSGPRQGMDVFLDEEWLGQTPIYRTEIPPGHYRLTVRHPLYDEWNTDIDVQSGDVARILANAVRRQGADGEEEGFSQRDWGIVTLVGGSAFLASGVVLGVLAKADADRYHRNVNTPARDEIRNQAQTEALLADLSFGVAVALLTTSVILFLVDTRPDDEEWEGISDELVRIDVDPSRGRWLIGLGGHF